MERLKSFIRRNNRFEEIRNRLIFLQSRRRNEFMCWVKGKNEEGEIYWHILIFDCDKRKEYFEVYRRGVKQLDVRYFGKILETRRGPEIPQTVHNIMNKFVEDLENQLFVFKLQGNNSIYYALCDADKRSEMAASRTAEEVERFGKILYLSLDEDPPEALWDVIEKGYFIPLLTGERSYRNLCSPNAGEARSQNEEDARRRKELSKKGIEIARRGDVQEVRGFLREVDYINWTDENGWTMLHHAAHCDDLNMIRTLKDMNANTQVRDNICGRKPLHIAAREGHTKAVELFLIDSDSVDDVDRSGWTALHYAAWNGESRTVEYLISKNASTNIRDNFLGKKPVHVAVTEGHTHIVEIFLEKGVNIDDTDSSGRTLVYYSALAQRYEMAQYLIERNANVNIKTAFGSQSIHISAEVANAQLTELFVNHGADIDSRMGTGETFLHRAADKGLVTVVQMLLEKGANPNILSNESKTPYDKAVEQLHFEAASCLAEKMSEIFRNQAKYSEALVISKKLFLFLKTKLGQDDPKTIKSQENVAIILYQVGRYEEALEVFDILLNKKQNVFGLRHLNTSCTKFDKGRVYVALWKFDKASDIFIEVYNIWKDSFGTSDPRTLHVAREIACMHAKIGKFDEALSMSQDIYETRRANDPDVNEPATWQAMQDVAIVLINTSENEKALRILKDVFEKRISCLGANHPATLSTDICIKIVEKRLGNATKK